MSVPEYMVRVRPIGVSILSVLHAIGGIMAAAFGVVFPFIVYKQPKFQEALVTLGIPLPLLVVGILILAFLGIASGVGMWIGVRWGWYLGSFYYMYSLVRSLSAILTVRLTLAQMPLAEAAAMTRDPQHYYLKFGVRAFIAALIFLYFFKNNVLEYFALKDLARWKVVAAEFGICMAIAVAFTVWGAIAP
jgi:hypothetical protein